MTASEFAFLALGLVLGIATGAALVMVLVARPPAREVRLTVEHGAVPRRAATLSSDAFASTAGEVARGGPADRRRLDRDAPPADPPEPFGSGLAIGVMATAFSPTVRTPVPSAIAAPRPSSVPIVPDRDPSLDALRIQAALTAERLHRATFPSATGLLDPGPDIAVPARIATSVPVTGAIAPSVGLVAPRAGAVRTLAPAVSAPLAAAADASSSGQGAVAPDTTPAIVRILRGDMRAMLTTVAILAGADAAERRPWQAAVISLADGLGAAAIGAGWLDFPVGSPFWDSFTTGQCRAIAAGLAASGFRFDRLDGWQEGRVPGYRELTAAVASAGLEPRRIRAWPTQDEIARLYGEVTVASDDYLAAHAPDLDLEAVRALIGPGGPERARLWGDWDRVRRTLLEPIPA